jgi:hypothetical protein
MPSASDSTTAKAPRAPEAAPGAEPSRGGLLPRYPLAWIVFYLLVIDVGVNLFFGYPADPRDTATSKVQRYFEYGRSIEGKLDRMTRASAAESAPIVAAGWLSDDARFVGAAEQVAGGRGRPIVTFYGMSHADLLAKDLAGQDATLAVRFRTAPQAAPTWSFTAYLHDRPRVHSDVVVLTVMTNTIALLSATSGTTMYFDGAYPYTWPRYLLEGGKLRAVAPPFVSVEGYRKFFFDPPAWSSYLDWLAQHDKHYDPLLFRRTPLDKSCLVRLLRRSYALATRAARQSRVYDEARGFDASSEEALVLAAVVAEFARQARAEGSIPVVYVVNNLGTSDHAFALLQPTLARHRIPYLSSHELVAPNDPRNYLPDSHFEHGRNLELARAMARLIHGQLARPAATSRAYAAPEVTPERQRGGAGRRRAREPPARNSGAAVKRWAPAAPRAPGHAPHGLPSRCPARTSRGRRAAVAG